MKKQQLAIAACIGCLTIFAAGGMALASSPVLEAGRGVTTEQNSHNTAEVTPLEYDLVPAWGTIQSINGDRIVLDNLAQGAAAGEVVVQIADQESRILDAVEGLPVALADLKEGDFIYAYLSPMMTLSLPPITNAKVIICNAPADFKVPEYLNIKAAVFQEDGSVALTAYNGNTYHVPADCTITPYLTRNMASLQDLAHGRSILLWSDSDGNARKIVVFAQEQS
ncbi:MAG: hypothetical protein ACRDBO_22105 [Lachnospiraceae bacterium]